MRNFMTGIAVVIGLGIGAVHADTRVQTITLIAEDGSRFEVGTLQTLVGGAYEIAWNDQQFGDYFLSMRPFKCLEGPEKLWCRVDYPYAINRTVTADDATDLEYDMLWVWKSASDYGINMWNGVYYKLSPEGSGWQGVLHEMDMDVLAAPPEDGSLRPISEDMLDEGDPDSHWLPRLEIR